MRGKIVAVAVTLLLVVAVLYGLNPLGFRPGIPGTNQFSNASLGVLANATFYNGPEPSPGNITVPLNGTMTSLYAIPGEVLVFASNSSTPQEIKGLVTAEGGHIISSVPLEGLYEANVSVGGESSFISSLQSSALIDQAIPNVVGSHEQASSSQGTMVYPAPRLVDADNGQPTLLIPEMARAMAGAAGTGTSAYPPVVMVTVDDFGFAGSHGSEILGLLNQAYGQGIPGGILTSSSIIEVQDFTCGPPGSLLRSLGECTVSAMVGVSVISAVIQAAQDVGDKVVISYSTSYAPEDWLHGEAIVLNALSRAETHTTLHWISDGNVLLVQAAGNKNLDLTYYTSALDTYPGIGSFFRNNYMLIGQSLIQPVCPQPVGGIPPPCAPIPQPSQKRQAWFPWGGGSNYGTNVFFQAMPSLPSFPAIEGGYPYFGTSFATPVAAYTIMQEWNGAAYVSSQMHVKPITSGEIVKRSAYFGCCKEGYMMFYGLEGMGVNLIGPYGPPLGNSLSDHTTVPAPAPFWGASGSIPVSEYSVWSGNVDGGAFSFNVPSSSNLILGTTPYTYGTYWTSNVACTPPPGQYTGIMGGCTLPTAPPAIEVSGNIEITGNLTLKEYPNPGGGFSYAGDVYLRGSGTANVLWAVEVGNTSQARYCDTVVSATISPSWENEDTGIPLNPSASIHFTTQVQSNTPIQFLSIPYTVALGASYDPSCPFPGTGAASFPIPGAIPGVPYIIEVSGAGGSYNTVSGTVNLNSFPPYTLCGLVPSQQGESCTISQLSFELNPVD